MTVGYDDRERYHVPRNEGRVPTLAEARQDVVCLVKSCQECGTVQDVDYPRSDGEEPARSAQVVNPLHAHMRSTFESCLEISRVKNRDYAGDADPLANFRACTAFGISLPQGIMVRLSDKFARIGNLLDGRDPAVADERLADTIRDACNYLAILAYALEAE